MKNNTLFIPSNPNFCRRSKDRVPACLVRVLIRNRQGQETLRELWSDRLKLNSGNTANQRKERKLRRQRFAAGDRRAFA